MQAAEVLGGGIDSRLDLVRIGHVRRSEDGTFTDLLGDRVAVRLGEIADDRVAAGGDDLLNGGSAEPGRAACDESGQTLDTHRVTIMQR